MDDKIKTILDFLNEYSLTLKEIKIFRGSYIIILQILNPNFDFNILSNKFDNLCINLNYRETNIEDIDDFILVTLPVIFTKEILHKLSAY